MYDIKTNSGLKDIIFGLIFFVGGCVLVILAIFLCFGGRIKKAQLDSSVKAVEISENKHNVGRDTSTTRTDDTTVMYSPSYTYIVDGIEYECKVNLNLSSPVKEEYDTVYYDSKNPHDCLTEYQLKPSFFYYVFLVLSFLMPLSGLQIFKNYFTNSKKMKKLSTNGILYKNIPYEMVPLGTIVNQKAVLYPEISFQLEDGRIVKLPVNPKLTKKSDGMVDLLIDPSDPTLYYIDSEINRKF